MINSEKFYNCEEVSEILNVKTPTIRAWIYKGLLPVTRFGGCVRVRGGVLESLIQKGTEK